MSLRKGNNIRLINRVSDVALATIILGIAMMVFGLSMILGSVIGLSHNYSFIGGPSHLLLLAALRGISFTADGVMLSAFCILVAGTSPLSNGYKILHRIALVATVYNFVILLLGIFLGSNFMGSVVSLAGMTISGIIMMLIKKLIFSAERRIISANSRAFYSLRKAG